MDNDIIIAEDVSKVFEGNIKSAALNKVNIRIQRGEFCSITGPSGSGKSTLLHLLAALDQPSSGEIYINSNPISKLSENQLNELRQKYIGLVFQFHFLLPEFTAFENLIIPQLLMKKKQKDAENRAMEILEKVKISHKKDSRPSQMSGGEQQRVAIARALVNNPSIILADEPTGNLDSVNSKNIYELLRSINQETGQTILVVTHDNNFASQTNRIIEIIDGTVKQ